MKIQNQDSAKLKNYFINSGFHFAQRNPAAFTGSTVLFTSGSGNFVFDRFRVARSSADTHQHWTALVAGSLPAEVAPDIRGLMRQYVTVSQTPTTTSSLGWYYPFEGLDMKDLTNKTVCFSFYCRTNAPGTYSMAFRKHDGSHSFVKSFTITQANVFQRVVIVIPLKDAPTTFGTDNTLSGTLGVFWHLGTSFQTSSEGQWIAQNMIGITGMSNGLAVGNYFDTCAPMLNIGHEPAPYQMRAENIASELLLCQRYYEKSFSLETAPDFANFTDATAVWFIMSNNGTGGVADAYTKCHVPFKVTKRASPTVLFYNATTASNTAARFQRNSGGTYTNGSNNPANSTPSHFSVDGNYTGSGSLTDIRSMGFHWSADAEVV